MGFRFLNLNGILGRFNNILRTLGKGLEVMIFRFLDVNGVLGRINNILRTLRII